MHLVFLATETRGGYANGARCGETGGVALLGRWSLDSILSGGDSEICKKDNAAYPGYCTRNNQMGTILHEMGHAFGLPHPCEGPQKQLWALSQQECDKDIMQNPGGAYPGGGFAPIEVEILKQSQFFAATAGQRAPVAIPATVSVVEEAAVHGAAFPNSVAVDGQGNIWSVDTRNSWVYRITPAGRLSRMELSSGVKFSQPTAVAVDRAGNVYIADAGNHRVVVIDSKGDLHSLSGLGMNPVALFIDYNGNVWVADAADALGSPATLVRTLSIDGRVIRQRNLLSNASPDALAITRSDGVFIAYRAFKSVVRFDSTGQIKTVKLDADPAGIFPGPNGDLWVADAANSRILQIDSQGQIVNKWGTPGAGDGELSYPEGLTLDAHGNVYVADTGNGRIQEFTSAGAFLRSWNIFP